MKKAILLLLILTAFTFAESSVREALGELEEASKTALLVGSLFQFVLAVIFLGATVFVFLKKLKGVEKKETLWILLALVLGGIGLILLIGAVLGIISYFLLPTMTESLLPS
jgi:hypothetical protein